MSAADIVAGIATAGNLPLTQARTLPREAYTDEHYFAHETDVALRKSWLCAGHVSQLDAPGKIFPIDLLGEPLVLIRGNDDVVRVVSRVCPHRSADILLDGETTDCSAARGVLTCPYHRWSFALDGALLGAPHMQKAEGFDKSEISLAAIRSEIWQGFIFINFDGRAPSLQTHYAALTSIAAPWQLADMAIVISMDWDCDFNWKVMVENWIESYHHLGPHSGTLNPLMPAQDTWTEAPNAAFIHAHLPMTGRDAAPVRDAIENGTALPGFLPIRGLTPAQQTEWNLFLGFPCFMLLLARDRAIWYRLQPLAAGRCKLTTTTLVSRASLDAPDFAATLKNESKMLQDFHLEDMVVNAAVQRGLNSHYAARGRLSHLEAPVWQFHRLLAAQMNAAR